MNASIAQATLASQVAAYLAQHIGSDLTISQLAQQFHVSPTHLQNAFHSFYGSSVMVYYRKITMQAAAELLCHTEQSVGQIAGICGYDNPGKFSAAFRRHFGITPVQHRKANHVVLEHFSVVSE